MAARTNFARDYLAYGRMQPPPAIRCGTINIDHGLAEGGWLRRIRFAKPNSVLSAFGLSAENPSRGQDGTGELSVQQWIKSMLASPATPAQRRTLTVPSVMSQAYTLADDRLGIVLVNLRPNAEETVSLPVDPVAYGLLAGSYELWQTGLAEQRPLGVFPRLREIKLRLPPRAVVLVEARRSRP